MAALNFPDPNVQTSYTNPDTGIAYEWANGLWKAVRTAQTAPELFVDVDGDNLTGNLTLGTDKIVLDATIGSATFTNNVDIKRSTANSDLKLSGSDTHAVWLSNSNFALKYDGSAEFAGETIVKGDLLKRTAAGSTVVAMRDDYLRVYDSPVSYDDYTISLEKDGSATFAGPITLGTWANTSDSAIYMANQADSGQITVKGNGSSSQSAFSVYSGGWSGSSNQVAAIKADGSATFAGSVEVGGDPFQGADIGVKAYPDGSFVTNQTTGTNKSILVFNGGTDPTAYIQADGTASFKEGSVTINSSSSLGRLQVNRTNAGKAFVVNNNSNDTVSILGNGSATFADGNLTITSAGRLDAPEINSMGTAGFYAKSPSDSGYGLRVVDSSGTHMFDVNFQGNVMAKGYINVGINSSNLAKLQFENGASRLQYSNVTGHLEVYTNNAVRNKFLYNGQGTAFSNQNVVYPEPDNSILLGNSSYRWQAIWAANGTIQTSDSRLKHEVENSVLGTDFIKALRPVSYKWIEGGKSPVVEGKDENGDDVYAVDENGDWIYESNSGARQHWGFIAQEVKQAVDNAGVDFGGWVLADKDDADSTQSLRYDQFIAPLTKALQEAIAEIETLKAEVAALKAN